MNREEVYKKITNPNTKKYLHKLAGKPDDSVNHDHNQMSKKKTKEDPLKVMPSPQADSQTILNRDMGFDSPNAMNSMPLEAETKPLHQRSKMRKLSSKLMERNFVGKGANNEKILSIINEYLPIATFLSYSMNHEEDLHKLGSFLKKSVNEMDKFEPENMLQSHKYLMALPRQKLKCSVTWMASMPGTTDS